MVKFRGKTPSWQTYSESSDLTHTDGKVTTGLLELKTASPRIKSQKVRCLLKYMLQNIQYNTQYNTQYNASIFQRLRMTYKASSGGAATSMYVY